MKNTAKITLLAFMFSIAGGYAFAEKYKGEKSQSGHDKSGNSTPAEACQPATGATDLDLNNVRARINTGGDMWWDLQNLPKYEIPKNSKKHSMYSGALWMAGVDVNGQLKCAALRYRQIGNDFWPGPLTTDGTAAVDAATCKKYDRHYKITRSEVNEFIANFQSPDPTYIRPRIIDEWPAHGDQSIGQDFYLAPFYDLNGDGAYSPDDGDYPYYDLENKTCGTDMADRVLFGDMTLWWVFNDKGNIHTETKGQSIGFEIRAQAFAFATNDEINSMTFYNYQIINRSTYTLTDTYFSQWVDTDLGYAQDDYIGCDVMRGLGYCYNGVAVDGSGKEEHYGANPPAIGVDFFQGPYMDTDGKDNPIGIDEGINGVNFGDGIVDNERFGMRRFVYHNNSGVAEAMTDPDVAIDYYNLLRGIWKDGTPMYYGSNAHISTGPCGPVCYFMFPGDSDPLHWGTNYQLPNCNINDWTEANVGNAPYDRRFMHSAGPFTLLPGAVNYITVGIPWARATSGGPWESVELLLLVDDKCQRLFDNCFQVVNGPDAPEMTIQELDRELILYLSNKVISNNYQEKYEEYDFNIVTPDGVYPRYDSIFRFQGYQIFQVKDASVSVADLHNVNLARQVAQCDKKDGVSRLINYYFDENLGANVAIEEVDGEDAGIKHSFKLTEDQFATGDKRLINHKKYYFIAIAYAYNNYKDYIPTDANSLDGQKQRYKAGRKSPAGSIKSVVGIPHIPTSQSGGVVIQAEYGYGPKITRIEGQGNGGLVLDLTPETETEILSKTSSPYMSVNPEYQNLKGPVDVKVVDPLNVPDARFSLKFVPYDTVALADADIAYTYKDINNVDQTIYLKLGWELTNQTTGTVYTSDQTIGIYNEQVIPEIGLSVAICQTHLPGDTINEELFWDPEGNGVIESSIEYADSSKMWLGGISDVDAPSTMNWIRAGSAFQVDDPYNDYYNLWDAGSGKPLQYVDPKESYEKIINGTWTAYRLAFHDDVVTSPAQPIKDGLAYDMYPGVVTLKFHKENNLTNVASIDLVLTPDQSKWTRCPVLEMQYDNALSQDNGEKFLLRKHASVDINGTNESGTGMGWFPGYAINVETGERLNIAFGEDSWLKADNGADMLFNPTERYYDDVGFQTIFGGKHYVYIFGHNGNSPGDVPAYDQGAYIWNELYAASIMPVTTPIQKINKARKISFVYDDVMWCGIPMKQYGFGTGDADWLACDVKIRIRVNRPYMQNYGVHGSTNPQNNNLPMYEFSTSDIATQFGVAEAAQNALELINIVPNPYYAFSSYETNQLDNRVRITNLPEKCQISIFTLSGSLVRKYDVDKSGVITPRRQGDEESKTSIDWDLKNYAGIPIASGIYLIHVKVEGVGERVIKWFGTMRPVDLDSF